MGGCFLRDEVHLGGSLGGGRSLMGEVPLFSTRNDAVRQWQVEGLVRGDSLSADAVFSHSTYSSNSFRESTPPHIRQLIGHYC